MDDFDLIAWLTAPAPAWLELLLFGFMFSIRERIQRVQNQVDHVCV